MSLSPEEVEFLKRERRIVSGWPVVGGGALFGLLVVYAWMSIDQPHLANPAYVYSSLANDALTGDSVYILVMLAPILMMMLFIAVGVMLGYVFAFMRKEKRLLDIIDRQARN